MVTNITNIDLRSWSGDDRIVIPTAMLRAAFTENTRLTEYCHMGDMEKAEITTAEPYILEALMDLVKRAHVDPSARNIYLNPKRADQVMVFDEKTWKVETLTDATRSLFDSVAGDVRKMMYKDDLSMHLKGAACFVPQLYNQEPERFIKKARAPMAAHLSNTAPINCVTGPMPKFIAEDDTEPPAKPEPRLANIQGLPKPATTFRIPLPEPVVNLVPARPHLSPEMAAAMYLKKVPASLKQEMAREVKPEHLKKLAEIMDADVDRVVQKLWEAAEDKLIVDADAKIADEICAVYDRDATVYD